MKLGEGVVESFQDCISNEERKQRFSVYLINGLVWLVIGIFVVATLGIAILFVVFARLIEWLFSEYNVRKLQSYGCTVSAKQFPTVQKAANAVCERFGVENNYRIILLPSGELNALAISFAKKKVVVILSEMMEAVIENQDQLQALLAHELCHLVLDHTWTAKFILIRPMRYRAARELTCDNAALIGAGNLDATKALLRKLCVGRKLYKLVDEAALVQEAQQIYRGFTGWLLRNYLSHPPAGARLKNVTEFYEEIAE